MAGDDDSTTPPGQIAVDQLTTEEIFARLKAAQAKAQLDEIAVLADEIATRERRDKVAVMDELTARLIGANLKTENEQETKMNPAEKQMLDQLKVYSSIITEGKKPELANPVHTTVNTLLNLAASPEYTPEIRKQFESIAAGLATTGQVPMAAPDFVTQMRLPAMRAKYDERGVVNKLIHKIKKFTGTDPDFKWQQFWAHYSIAVQNTAYNRYELRAIFLSCLDGAAMDHYQAFLQVYSDMSYEQLVKAFKDRYDDTKEVSMASIIGKTQATNEDVLTFRDRLLNASMPFRPVIPSKQVIIQDSEGKDHLVDNAAYQTQKLQYDAKLQEHEAYMTRFYVMGLREEIIARLQTTSFNTLEDAAKAAKEAEDYLKSVALMRTHHVRVNAMYKGTSMPRGAQFSDSTGGAGSNSARTKSDSECFNCGSTDHWKRDCPKPIQSRPRSRSGSRATSRSRDNSRRRSSFPDKAQFVNMMAEAIQQVNATRATRGGKRGGQKKDQKKSRSKSRSKSRDGSRGRNRSSSRGSRYGSRSNSRSGSKN
jgi:hypothetical protein